MENQKTVVDTTSNLLKTLRDDAKTQGIETKGKESGFPARANVLSRQLKQLTPTFRKLGYQIKVEQYNLRDKKYPRNSKVVYIVNDNFSENAVKT